MAKAISRNYQQIRYLCHSLASSQQWQRSSFHTLSNTLNTIKSLPLSPLAMRLDGLENGLISYRFLCTSSSSNQSNSGLGGSSTGANSGKSESSGGSQKTEHGKGKSIRGSPVSWMSFFLLVCTGAGLVYYYDREKRRHIEDITNASTSVKQGPSVGKAAIGGPFSLIDHNGKPVTEKDFFGKWTVVYFGFTHCPDICPDELQKLAAAVDKIKEKSGIQVVPLFISVDPERDTVEQVGEYVKEFHPNLIGLTGTPEEIKKTARAYRVYYMKTEEEGSDYLVDHSIVMYLMDPKMEFVKFFGKNNDVDMLTDGIIKEIKQYKQAKA
ncbi:protein SCO1 homolog 1, mitochondrial [Lycium ferocissimum]|uniref:protein SCO1 homolog 1, mitochondrial n=1 Tax=Lycium ferocissimum TaxID=112874 RepID=UPI00281613BE|nr:protein SCO1 homolog 1, mitochondrial [Lycium ferocissimum]